MFPTACTFAPRRKTHWFAVGQSTSSVVPSGDQTTSPNVPGPAKRRRARPGWSMSTSFSSLRDGEPHRDGELVTVRPERRRDEGRAQRADRAHDAAVGVEHDDARRRRDGEEPPVVRPFERERQEVGLAPPAHGARERVAPDDRAAARDVREVEALARHPRRRDLRRGRVEQAVAASVAADDAQPAPREVGDACVGQRARPARQRRAARARAPSARERPRRGRAGGCGSSPRRRARAATTARPRTGRGGA